MTNNSIDPHSFSRVSVYAVMVPHYMTPGFAIPLARPSETSNSAYTPFTSDHNLIDGFSPIIPQGRVIELRNTFEVEVGQEEIFAVVDYMGEPAAGTRKELAKKIIKWINKVESYTCRFNFAVFCDNKKLIYDIGKIVYRNKISELGNEQSAARWFISAFICVPVIRKLNSAYHQSDLFTEQLLIQTGAEIVIESPLKANIYLPREMLLRTRAQREYYRTELRDTLAIANICTGFSVSIKSRIEEKEESPSNEAHANFINSEISHIRAISPQEKRVATLISTYLKHQSSAINLLDKYEDSSGYANRVIDLLLAIANSLPDDSVRISVAVAKAIPRLVRIAYPQQRGRVVLEFARELGIYPEVSRAIKHIIYTSRQREIEEISAEALSFLRY